MLRAFLEGRFTELILELTRRPIKVVVSLEPFFSSTESFQIPSKHSGHCYGTTRMISKEFTSLHSKVQSFLHAY